MGFNKVYKALQEVFPQVDPRVLRAVAIENSKDADAAVEVILIEVIPFLEEKCRSPSSSGERSIIELPVPEGLTCIMDPTCVCSVAVDATAIAQTDGFLMSSGTSDEEQNGSSVYDANARGLNEEQNDCQIYDTNTGGSDEGKYGSSTYDPDTGISDEQNCSSTYNANAEDFESVPDADVKHHQLLAEGIGDHIQVNGEYVSGETVLSEMSQENIIGASDQTADCNTSNLEDLNTLLSHTVIALHESSSLDNAIEVKRDGDEEKSNVSLGEDTSLTVQGITFTPEGSGELVVIPDMLNSDPRDSQLSCSTDTSSTTEMVKVNIEDDSALNSIVTRSGQICDIDSLYGMIEDARSHKGILSSAQESVINLLREVEIREREVEEAKEAAAKAGLDTLRKVEDLKEMIQRAMETNERHAAEVYGERAILVTEVKELQSRLVSLSLERDKSLAIIDERRQTLASRLAAAEEKIKVYEKEKLEKEESALKKLAEQEFSMEKVVEEVNMIKQAAEDNAKKHALVDDCARAIDMLQGELSVISQDLSSSQTSTSSSSSKSLTHDQVDQVPYQYASSENQKITDIIPHSSEQQALRDAGWEIFENADYI